MTGKKANRLQKHIKYASIMRMIVSLSGSGLNFIFAAIFSLAGMETLGMINLVFGVVNLLPLPGSDGLRVFHNLKDTT